MVSIPIDVINYICEFAAGSDKKWYPFFSPKTGIVSWKVNPYCDKSLRLSNSLLNPIIESTVIFHNNKTNETSLKKSRLILFKNLELKKTKIYIEFDADADNDNNSGKFMFRCLTNLYYGFSKSMLYLNGTLYGEIFLGLSDTGGDILIYYETF